MLGMLEKFNTNSVNEYYQDYMGYLFNISKKIDVNKLDNIIDCFFEAYNEDKTIFFVGNGGSAATASHFCEDLAEVGRKLGKKIFKCISLTDNTSYITAVANDYGYDQVFTKQLEGIFSKGDVLISITASGNSPNVLSAIDYVNKNKGQTIGFLGFNGGKANESCDISLIAKTNQGEYGPVEDLHMIWVHLITTFLYFKLKASEV
ncbi:MAG: SIS domain-containing protein [Pseudomonadota bacterium]